MGCEPLGWSQWHKFHSPTQDSRNGSPPALTCPTPWWYSLRGVLSQIQAPAQDFLSSILIVGSASHRQRSIIVSSNRCAFGKFQVLPPKKRKLLPVPPLCAHHKCSTCPLWIDSFSCSLGRNFQWWSLHYYWGHSSIGKLTLIAALPKLTVL